MERVSSPLSVLIVAGGTGTRLGAGMPKQMLPLAGRPILAHTIDRFLAYDPQLVVVVVLHASLLPDWPAFTQTHFLPKDLSRIHACAGGKERTESVHAGLDLLAGMGMPEQTLVAIHDAVRPFISKNMLEQGFAMAEARGNAVASVPVKSSLRMKTETGSVAVDRSTFFHVQTPQIFKLGEILHCYEQRDESAVFTDDASLAEAQGFEIHLYTGDYDNVKITTTEDLIVAEELMKTWKNKA